MGCNVEFFAFREEPDSAKLKQIKWLTITFFEQVQAGAPPSDKKVDSLVGEIDRQIKAVGGTVCLFYSDRFRQCAALAKRLGQAVAHVGGNDEGLDGFAAFDGGKVIGASFEIDWDKGIVVAPDGTVAVAHYFPEGADEARVNPRMQNQNATTGLAAFFGADDWLVSSDPYDFDAGNYEFLAGQGEAPPVYKPFSAQLWDQLGPTLDLGGLFTALEPYVEKVLAADLGDADKDRRFTADEYPGGFLVYLNNLRLKPKWHQVPLFASLQSFLRDLSAYTRALRPKPEFRPSSFDGAGTRRGLVRRWQSLKLQARLLS
jgi:hypothetical protein